MKNRGVAIILALFLGGLGIHRFYVGQIGWGFLFLIFCWTFIPTLVALIDILRYWIMGEEEFHRRFNSMIQLQPRIQP